MASKKEEQFRPMLACKLVGSLKHNDYVIQPKLDGVRCVVRSGLALSRTLKPIPNAFIRSTLEDASLEGLDGELIVGAATGTDVYNRTISGVMSESGAPDFTYYVFDYTGAGLDAPYAARYRQLQAQVDRLESPARDHVQVVKSVHVFDEEHMHRKEEELIGEGYEGAILRRLSSPYKTGRSTLGEGWLLKVKRFETDEARIIGFECLYSNQNEAQTDERGYTKRSTRKENQVPQELLGNLTARDLKTGIEFSIGSGFTAQERAALWADKENLIGQIVSYQHFAYGEMDGVPRFPTYRGMRSEIDMGEPA